MNKYLVIDCISRLPEGRDLYEQLAKLVGRDQQVKYLEVQKLKNRKGYKWLKIIDHFLVRNIGGEKGKYYFPNNTHFISKKIAEYKPTHIIWMGLTFPYISTKALNKLKTQFGIKSFLIDIDINRLMGTANTWWFYLNKEVIRHEHILMVSQKVSSYLQAIGHKKVTYFPAFTPSVANIKKENKEIDVLFYGEVTSRRLITLNQLTNRNIVIVGEEWTRIRKYKNVPALLNPSLRSKLLGKNAYFEELASLIYRSKIILNISGGLWFTVESGITVRTYQVLMHGGFLLTEYCRELEETLTPGKDVETYRDMEELDDKINFYLKHDALREKIAQQGRQTALRYHSTARRAEQLLQHLEMKHPTLEWGSQPQENPIKNKIVQTLD